MRNIHKKLLKVPHFKIVHSRKLDFRQKWQYYYRRADLKGERLFSMKKIWNTKE